MNSRYFEELKKQDAFYSGDISLDNVFTSFLVPCMNIYSKITPVC